MKQRPGLRQTHPVAAAVEQGQLEHMLEAGDGCEHRWMRAIQDDRCGLETALAGDSVEAPEIVKLQFAQCLYFRQRLSKHSNILRR
jgi:hypothetical protein